MEDHRWWWRSFLCGGSTGLFIFGYACFHLRIGGQQLAIETQVILLPQEGADCRLEAKGKQMLCAHRPSKASANSVDISLYAPSEFALSCAGILSTIISAGATCQASCRSVKMFPTCAESLSNYPKAFISYMFLLLTVYHVLVSISHILTETEDPHTGVCCFPNPTMKFIYCADCLLLWLHGCRLLCLPPHAGHRRLQSLPYLRQVSLREGIKLPLSYTSGLSIAVCSHILPSHYSETALEVQGRSNIGRLTGCFQFVFKK